MNALKNWLAVVINVVAMGWFLARGLVVFLPCVSLMSGAILGGFVSGKLSQKVPSEKLRIMVVIYGFVMTAWFVSRTL